MPYFVFRIKPGPSQLVKSLEMERECDNFPDAKTLARTLRAAQVPEDTTSIRVIFAKDRLEAEELLNTPREVPILREWEK
jgi:hypothetical protein